MGMYDSVIVECPKCGTRHEFQSKSGECQLVVYTLENCPDAVMENINRHAPSMCKCGTLFHVDIPSRKAEIDLFISPNKLTWEKAEKISNFFCKLKLRDIGGSIKSDNVWLNEISILKLKFDIKGKMAIVLTDGRILIVPLKYYQEIKKLSVKKRKMHTIVDKRTIIFKHLNNIYHISDFIGSEIAWSQR